MKQKILFSLAMAAMLIVPSSVSAQSYGDVDGVTSATQQTEVQRPRRVHHYNRLTVDSLNTLMKANLGLTSEQETKVKALNEKYKDIIEGPRPPKNGPCPAAKEGSSCQACPPQHNAPDTAKIHEFMAKIRARRQSYDTELKAILSDSQYADYEKIKSQFASQRRPRHRKNAQ